MNPNIRTVTDLTTIPASVVQVGTLTPFAGDVLLLEYSGTASALDAILVQAGANKDQQKTALWVWDGTSTAPFNVTSWFGKFIKVDRDASAYTGDFNLIETKLFGWEVISTGDGTGTVSGSAIGALNTISFKPFTDFFVDPVVIEGNVGDNLTVLEFYNQQAGSGNGSGSGLENYIEADKAGFLALVAADALTFPALYKITDIGNGLFVNTLSANTFSPDATVSLFVPDYIGGGDNLGQMDFLNIPSVGVGEYVIWGDHYWINNTASPITPTITDEITLAGGLTQIAKASGSIYETVIFECTVDNLLNIYSITNAVYGSTWDIGTGIQQAYSSEFGYIYAPINNFIITANLVNIRNYKGDLNNGVFLNYVTGGAPNSEKIYQNFGRISGVHFNDSGNEFIGNYVDPSVGFGKGGIANVQLVGGSRFNGNKLVGEDATILGIELWDNCQLNNNELNGVKSAIWDVRTGENCQFNSNIINSDAVFVGNVSAGFSDVDMMQFDEVNGNVLNGDEVVIEVINMLGHSKFNNNTFNGKFGAGVLAKWSGFQMLRSGITDNTMNADFKYWRDIWMSDAKLRNATDIQVQNCTFEGIDLDLTGFTTDIIGQTIQSGKGWFVITHDFTANPLNSGSAVLYNIIPIGAKVTDIKAFGSATGGVGATLAFGIDTDAPNLIPAAVLATVNAGQIYNLLSATATANRSLAITAGVANVTGGSVTVLVEFMV